MTFHQRSMNFHGAAGTNRPCFASYAMYELNMQIMCICLQYFDMFDILPFKGYKYNGNINNGV